MSKHYDPKMHSAEHILNRAMVTKFGCDRCFSAHINKKKSKCDYHFPRPLTHIEIREIENTVNAQIQKDLPVQITRLSKDEAQNRLDLSKVPDIDQVSEIRVVAIGEYDCCPCIGPHVNSTMDIGTFKITTTGYENGVLRIRFKLHH